MAPAAPAASATPENDLAAKIDPLFAAYADPAAHAPGCAVGVFRAGEILFAKGYGLANLDHDLPITPRTSFEIGSISKQLTATAILLLVQDGKLGLDDDVRRFIPELPDYGRPITVRHLLHHTGGLREYDALLSFSGWDIADVATEDEALHLVALQRGVNFAAGAAFSYSNTGYFLLSQIVRRVTGKTLAVFSKERIFDPLGMKDTTILDDHAAIVPRHATGYAPRAPRGFQVNVSAREMTGEGNIQSTIEDLARWDANFYAPKVGGRAWLDAMRTSGKRDDGTPVPYTMGLQLKTDGSRAVEEHSGGWAGYRSDGRRYPADRLSVFALCNRDDVNPMALTRAVAKAVLPAAPDASPSSGAGDAGNALGSNPVVPALDPTSLAGAYLEPESLTVRTFGVMGEGLAMGLALDATDAPPPVPMTWIDPRSVRAPGATSRWTFEPASGKAPARVIRTAPGEKAMTFERFEPRVLDAATMALYVGRYESPEMTHDFEVSVRDGKLFAGPWGKKHLAEKLAPLGSDVFTAGWFGLAFERAGRGSRAKVSDMVVVMDGHRAMRWTKRAEPAPAKRR